MLAIRLDEETENRLEDLSSKTGRTKTWYVRKAIETYIDDLEDAAIAASAYEEYELAAINKPDALRIAKYLAELEKLQDPRLRGKALSANLSGLWRYRIGDWRVLCRIEDGCLIVLVVQIGHRSTVYG